MWIRWLFFILFFSLIEYYAYQAIRTLGLNRFLTALYWIVSLLIFGNFIYHTLNFSRSTGFTHAISYAIGAFLALTLFQLVIVFFLLFEDIIRIPQALYRFFVSPEYGDFLPQRRKFLSQMAVALAALPFASLLIGMIKGKYNYKVLHYALEFDDLPEAFDGFTLTQISDIHSGSFDNAKKVAYGVDLINAQKSDVILFTGDIVNNKASELVPWKSIFSKLEAPQGKYSVLGNHDYGDYTEWPTEKDKENNLADLIKMQEEMGFRVLLNETHFFEKEGARIALIGVENWGKGGFKKSGDLVQASKEVNLDDFKILMSHDPSHWEAKVLPHPYTYHLTLSGHTHGMQFGIEIPGWIKWSPVKWRYKQWAGLYQEKEQWINVNRGFGFLGYPGRVGIWPEITVITLKRSNSEV